jgi:hypothetical protein
LGFKVGIKAEEKAANQSVTTFYTQHHINFERKKDVKGGSKTAICCVSKKKFPRPEPAHEDF